MFRRRTASYAAVIGIIASCAVPAFAHAAVHRHAPARQAAAGPISGIVTEADIDKDATAFFKGAHAYIFDGDVRLDAQVTDGYLNQAGADHTPDGLPKGYSMYSGCRQNSCFQRSAVISDIRNRKTFPDGHFGPSPMLAAGFMTQNCDKANKTIDPTHPGSMISLCGSYPHIIIYKNSATPTFAVDALRRWGTRQLNEASYNGTIKIPAAIEIRTLKP